MLGRKAGAHPCPHCTAQFTYYVVVTMLVHRCVGWIFAPGGHKAPRRGIPAPRSPAFPGLHRSHCWAVCYWAFCMLLFSPPAAAQQGPLLNGWQAVGGSRSVATGLGGGVLVQRAAGSQPTSLQVKETWRRSSCASAALCTPTRQGIRTDAALGWLVFLLAFAFAGARAVLCRKSAVRRAACVVRDACEMRCTS